ncbi:C40 family peptidase [Texcoconibacillus texcoconensis]|uniref:Hydrolase Nlp/P60 n=1 Tax=Texcoconibacillus texcoconensis TaxID=1095777 RepID=A0A840QSU5_9BACI|nr:C40 family peptidase [Texcoconibacillus texcoconensis]MBB5174592.1 hypothetical protein [Texcoconibacillus texcoconensis]
MKKWVLSIVGAAILAPQLTTHAAAVDQTDIVNYSQNYIGTPYQMGASTNTTSAFDCSSYLQHIYSSIGIDLPRTTIEQANVGEHVSRADLQKGDIIVFAGTYRPGISHTGMYIGGNQFISAKSSTGVSIASLDNPYWGPKYHSTRRVINEPTQKEIAIRESYIYIDVPNDHWAQNAIENLSNQEIILGKTDGTFAPRDAITREQAAMMIDRYFDLEGSPHQPYSDVDTDRSGASAIAAVTESGIMQGYKDETFRPEEDINREEIAAILYRAMPELEIDETIDMSESFSDLDEDQWSIDEINTVSQNEIILGYQNGTFGPADDTTRAQFATMLDRASKIE